MHLRIWVSTDKHLTFLARKVVIVSRPEHGMREVHFLLPGLKARWHPSYTILDIEMS